MLGFENAVRMQARSENRNVFWGVIALTLILFSNAAFASFGIIAPGGRAQAFGLVFLVSLGSVALLPQIRQMRFLNKRRNRAKALEIDAVPHYRHPIVGGYSVVFLMIFIGATLAAIPIINLVNSGLIASSPWWTDRVLLFLIGIAFLIGPVSIVFMVATRGLSEWMFVRRNPSAAIVIAITMALLDVRDVSAWTDATHRRKVWRSIEKAADIIDGPYKNSFDPTRKNLPGKDLASDKLRSLRTWLATPLLDTRAHLEEKLKQAHFLLCAAGMHELGREWEIPTDRMESTPLRSIWPVITASLPWLIIATSPVVAWWFAPTSIGIQAQNSPTDIKGTLGFLAIIVPFVVLIFKSVGSAALKELVDAIARVFGLIK